MVLSWYRIRLSRDDVESGEFDIVRTAFLGALVARYGPSGAALYGGWAEDGNTYWLYFTPSAHSCAQALFKIYSAEACDPPDTRRLEWLYGDSERPSGFSTAF